MKRGRRPQGGRASKRPKDDFFIESESSGDEDDSRSESSGGAAEDEYARETSDERKVRLAKEYLARLDGTLTSDGLRAGDELEDELQGDVEGDAVEGMDPVALRLHREALKLRGKLQKKVAERVAASLSSGAAPRVRILRAHRLSVTCLVLGDDESTAFSGSKDGSIVKWDLRSGRRLRTMSRVRKGGDKMDGHTGTVLALALSSDGKYLASGGTDRELCVWDAKACEVLYKLRGHRDTVTCLAFRKNTYTLYSGSADRTVKVWDLTEGAYVESLFGHQSDILSIDSLLEERAVTSGLDKTCRMWKIPQQTQLLFKGPKAAVDSVRLLNDDQWVTGSQDGSVMLWGKTKKKPLARRERAHGGKWVTSVGTRIYTDLAASGSSDGALRLWRVGDDKKLYVAGTVPVKGFINAICIANSGRFIALAVGQEHRLGRWETVRAARNGVYIVSLEGDELSAGGGGAANTE